MNKGGTNTFCIITVCKNIHKLLVRRLKGNHLSMILRSNQYVKLLKLQIVQICRNFHKKLKILSLNEAKSNFVFIYVKEFMQNV